MMILFGVWVNSSGSRNGAMGGAVGWRDGRGWGVHPLASKGVWGSAVSSPIGAWGSAPEAFTFFASNHAEFLKKNLHTRDLLRQRAL